MNANKSLKFEESGNDIRIDAGTLEELVDHVITGKSGTFFFLLYSLLSFLFSFLNEITKKM